MVARLITPNPVVHRNDGISVLTITLRNGQKLLCYVDTVDYNLVKNMKWGGAKGRHTYYADNALSGRQIHQILNPEWALTDHRDGNGLNNCRLNLRKATFQQNSFNARKGRLNATSKFKGVCWEDSRKSWRARIRINGKLIHLGRFKEEKDAADAYNVAARKYFGEFAVLNKGE